MNSPEYQEQYALFEWIALMEPQIPALKNIFAVPNGEYRHIATAVRLKKSGVKAGVPDILLAYPSSAHHGLFIELKAGKNRTTPAQNDWISRLQQAGYMCVVCYGWEEAKREILEYLEVEK
jgi:hypothetical protein